jgi:hydrogenase maturation factor
VDGEVKYTAFDVVPIPKTNSRLKKLIEDGRFLLCGNVQKKVNLDGFGPEDVGDYISLTVGDQMSFLNSPGPQRLSDKITFRPVQCNPKTKNNGCCQNGYWKIGKPCEEFIDNSCSDCPIVKGCIDDPDNNKVCPRECKPPKLPKRCDDKGDCVGP